MRLKRLLKKLLTHIIIREAWELIKDMIDLL